MPKKFTRQQLYDLVWTQATRTVAAEIGISDVALAKICRKADVPIPPRGYWARKAADQRVLKTALPPRFPGAADEFEIGGNANRYWYYSPSRQELLEMPVPPVPVFDESIEAVTARIQKLVGKVPCQKNFDKAFGDVAKLLSHDEERRKSALSYDKPRYESGIERRRLLILNSIFLAVHALGCKAHMNTSKYGIDDLDRRGITIGVGSRHVHFTLEQSILKGRYDRPDPDDTTLTLAFGSRGHPTSPDLVWKDAGKAKVETHLRDIVIAILVQAEKQHRHAAVHRREWIIERKADLQKELERERIEQERKERELRERQAKERVDALLKQAADLQKAQTIRTYVQAMRDRAAELPATPSELQSWSDWALKEADRIDPAKSNAFLRQIPV